jgi:hypothetical protein
VSNATHYLDDFFTCSSANTNECSVNLSLMLSTCNELGMTVNPAKTVEPTSNIEFLGIVIDSNTMELSMSQQ